MMKLKNIWEGIDLTFCVIDACNGSGDGASFVLGGADTIALTSVGLTAPYQLERTTRLFFKFEMNDGTFQTCLLKGIFKK